MTANVNTASVNTANVNVYECMCLLDTNKVAGNTTELSNQVHAILEKHKAEILISRPWDDRKLAYTVKGQKKALYYLIYIKIEGPNLAAVEHDCLLNENVLRFLFLKIDPKLTDVMLSLAREDRPVALQTVQQDPTGEDYFQEDDRGSRRGGGGGGGRRYDSKD